MLTSVWCCIFWSLVLITHTTVENILMSCLACHMTPEGKETQSVVCGLGPGHEGFVTEHWVTSTESVCAQKHL